MLTEGTMPRVTNTAPPRLLNSEMLILRLPDAKPDTRPLVCVVTMDTDDGAMELAMNVEGALQLHEHLSRFLDEAVE
jgi:hypothetical protein